MKTKSPDLESHILVQSIFFEHVYFTLIGVHDVVLCPIIMGSWTTLWWPGFISKKESAKVEVSFWDEDSV